MRHNSGRTTPKWHPTGQHLPERNPQRVEIRTDIHLSSDNLFRTGELWCSGKGPGRRDRGLSTGFIDRLGQAEIDNLGCHSALVLKAHHDIAWLDVPMNELSFVHRSQTGADLHRNLQSALNFKRSRALDEVVQGFPLHKLHRIEVIAPLPPKMKHRGDVWMSHARLRPHHELWCARR